VATARHDFAALTEAAAVFSAHIWDVPQQARKSLDEIRAAQKGQHRLLEEVAELQAAAMLQSSAPVVKFFADRDLSFIKMLAQKLTKSAKVVVLLGCGGAQPSIVFAQSPGLPHDMGALMKQTVQKLGTRGGGARDMAQGGAPDGASAEQAVREAAGAVG
jgi:alanyl-tRNA synthetase